LVFGLTLLAGVLLVWTRLRTRVAAIAVVLAGLVLAGVFWPTLLLHVLGPPLYWAAVIVVLLWIVSAPFLYGRRIREFNRAVGTTWATWVESNKAKKPGLAASSAATENRSTASEKEAGHE
jgi:hypothetical protein